MFGGAFDPPHRAHMTLADTALRQLGLDRLHVIPTGYAGHKTRELTPFVHRLAMTRLAFEARDKVTVDPREGERAGPSYTIDTLVELKAIYPGAHLFLIVGEDQARSMASWHRATEIEKFATICVAARAGSISAEARLNASSPGREGWQLLQTPEMDISATDLRCRLAGGESVAPLVFEPVARYIAHHHLYQTT